MEFELQPQRSPDLLFDDLHSRNTWITTHLLTPEIRKAGLVG